VAGLSDIEWTDATWNPVAGCSILSPGCTNCYAMRMAARLQAMKHPAYQGVTRKSGMRFVWSGKITLNEAALAAPLGWKKPHRVFVNSMSDLFHDRVPAEFIERVWLTMAQADWHVFQVLTKRPERMRDFLKDRPILSNVWVGTSVESAPFTSRIEALKKTPAAVRFVSFEPLLGPVGNVDLAGVHWAIVGGESGPGARQMETDWVEEIRTACREHGVAFFFKQWGGTNKKVTGRLYQGRTWDEFPEVPVGSESVTSNPFVQAMA
jgi:protein gp37